MIRSVSQHSPLHDAHRQFFEASGQALPLSPNGAGTNRFPLPSTAVTGAHGPTYAAGTAVSGVGTAPEEQHLTIATDDWSALFRAVQTQLRVAVGDQLGVLPHIPGHSAELSATLVQAMVLDCVDALDQLHEALKQERSQRPTADGLRAHLA